MITEKKVKREKINEVKITLLAVSRNESLARAYVSAFAAGLDPTLDELAEGICRDKVRGPLASISAAFAEDGGAVDGGGFFQRGFFALKLRSTQHHEAEITLALCDFVGGATGLNSNPPLILGADGGGKGGNLLRGVYAGNILRNAFFESAYTLVVFLGRALHGSTFTMRRGDGAHGIGKDSTTLLDGGGGKLFIEGLQLLPLSGVGGNFGRQFH